MIERVGLHEVGAASRSGAVAEAAATVAVLGMGRKSAIVSAAYTRHHIVIAKHSSFPQAANATRPRAPAVTSPSVAKSGGCPRASTAASASPRQTAVAAMAMIVSVIQSP